MGNNQKMRQEYTWIDISKIPKLKDKRIVLFGAGKGAQECIDYIWKMSSECNIDYIVDNDRTLWGKKLLGITVIAPSRIFSVQFDVILVTSISGEKSIYDQLIGIGLKYDQDFILIAKYPDASLQHLANMKDLFTDWTFLKGKKCLHIGPGGFLGLEVLLYSFGAEVVHSVDKFPFGITFPDVTPRYEDYVQLKNKMCLIESGDTILNQAKSRFDEVFNNCLDKITINSDKISYFYPQDVCELPFQDNSYDVVLSFAVLEHVKEPERAVNEICRVLKPGGMTYNRIITADHRSFSEFKEFNEFSFRAYSELDWKAISSKKFYQNRVIPASWKCLFQKAGMEMEHFSVDRTIDLDDKMLNWFSNDFHGFSREELGAVNCEMVLNKV